MVSPSAKERLIRMLEDRVVLIKRNLRTDGKRGVSYTIEEAKAKLHELKLIRDVSLYQQTEEKKEGALIKLATKLGGWLGLIDKYEKEIRKEIEKARLYRSDLKYIKDMISIVKQSQERASIRKEVKR